MKEIILAIDKELLNGKSDVLIYDPKYGIYKMEDIISNYKNEIERVRNNINKYLDYLSNGIDNSFIN